MGFKEIVYQAFDDAVKSAGYGTDEVRLVLEKPRSKEHGDICTPIALSLAKVFKKNPMEIAGGIAEAVLFPAGTVASIDIARPGYVNLRFAPGVLIENIGEIIEKGDAYGSSNVGKGEKCQVEYVSANPTGPLVIVSARAAAVGSAIVNLYRHVGFDAEGEYYVNDHGNQVEALGRSLKFRYRENQGRLDPGEEMGDYPGEYLKNIAERITPEQAAVWDADEDEGISQYGKFATENLLESIEADLEYFGVHFDNFFRESTLHPERVQKARQLIEEKGFAFKRDGALYLETTRFDDEKDRVLVKSDGNPTYFLGDIAYHMSKLERGHKWVVDLLGPDHHGHIPRMKAAAHVIGADDNWFQSLVVGWVRLTEGKKPISMSKRAGEFITMRELIDDVGSDVAKYFFLMRRTNTPLDFDLELARKQSDENPVYYVQYAHARISSVIRFAGEKGTARGEATPDHDLLTSDEERDLMVHLMFFPYEIEGAALSREPHRLTTYAKDLATSVSSVLSQPQDRDRR